MDRAATGNPFFVTLTYGGQTVNWTDSLYQTVNGLVGNVDWGESLTVVACEFPGLNTSLDPNRDQVFPLLIPSVSIDTTPPQVNYVASCPLCSIAIEKKHLFSCLPSQDLVPVVDQVSHPIQTVELALHSVNPFESLDMFPISDDLLPSDEVFLGFHVFLIFGIV